jgi:V-type H+-transporting ATPase subunit a
VYQDIVDTYGIPLYKEVNPALFTCVTFPFLFGIMFGDIGHGSVLLIVGLLLCLFDTCLRPRLPALSGLFKIRYLLLLMGLFSTFSGFLYNDLMSIPLFLRDSCYDLKTGAKLKGNKDCIYPFGIDPIWYLAKNELSFFNSFKMKLAVILGVLQMSLGVCMKAVNSIYFKRWLDLYHEFIPQIVLLWVLFGYMDVLIILKWLTNYEGKEGTAPSVISMMINMGLKRG